MAQNNSDLMHFDDNSGILTLSQADALVVGGKIVPQGMVIRAKLDSSSVSASEFISDANYKIVGVSEVHGVASSSGTLQVEKLTGTQAPGGGTNQLTGTMSLSGTANTVINGTMKATPDTIAAGDRIGLVIAGTMTGLAGCSVAIYLKRV